jgi:hypothetical protein
MQSLSCPLHRTPLVHVWLVVVSLLVTPPPLVRLRLYLSSHRRLSPRPSRASFLAGCCVTSRHAAASRPPAPPPLISPPPLITPLSCLLSGWLLRCLISRRRLPPACASASQRTAASHRAPLAIVCTMQTGEGLQSHSPPQSRRQKKRVFFSKPAPSTLNDHHPDCGHEKGIIPRTANYLRPEGTK